MMPSKRRVVAAAPNRAPRQGWRQALAAARLMDQEAILDPFAPNDFDAEDWTWEWPPRATGNPKLETDN